MSSGNFLTIGSVFYSLLLLIVFFSKKRLAIIENKIYSYLIVCNFIGLILAIACYYTVLYNGIIPVINFTVSRLYLIYLVSYIFIFFGYLIVSLYSIDNKINPKIKSFFSLLIFIFVIISIKIYTSPLYYHNEDMIIYSYGPAANIVYILATICMVIWTIILIINFDKVKKKKFIPIISFIFGSLIITIIQKSNPGLLLMTSMETFITVTMYFTIENPDVSIIEEIHNAKVISDNANYEKTMFLYDMTNEIRGITKEINSETNDILTETKNEEVNIENINESARNIKSSTGKFTALTNEILDIDRIDSASIKVYNEKYSIKLILKELVSTYKKKCNGKGIDFRTSIVSDLPEYLYGDAIGFKNVLISLLDNSIKYTNKGYIELNVNMIKKQDICRLIITIEDSGVGIKSNDLEKIFKKDTEYFNYNRSNLKNNLYNAKKLITLMGGTIIATSTYGKGTNMKIVLDQKEVIMEKNDYTKVYDKKKILLVDEGEYTEKILRKYLHNTGVEIDSVKLGKNCLDKIRDKERYDLILIDENISPISSIELMHKLKEVRNFNIPCILLTRNYGIEYSCYYVEQGFSDYLFKPIDKNALLNKINKF